LDRGGVCVLNDPNSKASTHEFGNRWFYNGCFIEFAFAIVLVMKANFDECFVGARYMAGSITSQSDIGI
jgi:hypothetical protein